MMLQTRELLSLFMMSFVTVGLLPAGASQAVLSRAVESAEGLLTSTAPSGMWLDQPWPHQACVQI